jgi:hypothetical protein
MFVPEPVVRKRRLSEDSVQVNNKKLLKGTRQKKVRIRQFARGVLILVASAFGNIPLQVRFHARASAI